MKIPTLIIAEKINIPKLNKALIISDINTCKFFSIQGENFIFETPPLASVENAEIIREKIQGGDFENIIMIGSGSLNDIVKYAAYKEGRNYIIFPTAPSMNGYVSANSSLYSNGVKQSFPCAAPEKIYCDISVIANAPKRLIASGFADSICRNYVRADVILSHHFFGTESMTEIFLMLKKYEDNLLKNVDNLYDIEGISALMGALLAGGQAMNMAGNSTPASGGEHLITHILDMKDGRTGDAKPFHGEQVAVASLISAKKQIEIMRNYEFNFKDFSFKNFPMIKMQEKFGEQQAKIFYKLYQKKTIKKLQNFDWDIIKADIFNDYIEADKLLELLIKAKAPIKASDIGCVNSIKDAVKFAPFTRDRFSFLDL